MDVSPGQGRMNLAQQELSPTFSWLFHLAFLPPSAHFGPGALLQGGNNRATASREPEGLWSRKAVDPL